MKALVIYDSLHRDTEKIARAIGGSLSGAVEAFDSVEVVKVGDVQPDQLAGMNLSLVGGPIHGSRPSPAMHEFLSHIPKDGPGGQSRREASSSKVRKVRWRMVSWNAQQTGPGRSRQRRNLQDER